ncbi:RHS repeat-associated core domain-containing protein [Pseudomonas savastanoi]|uniref:YD repeat-containing protein n=2 Tax=Pseudomonas savastanoi TaxID=29438 RepID=A0A3M3FF35_PSESG|nr:RHS repeat-associated core domain-containing protein [Pseudomonas savastanoi]KPY19798.1 YD repeat-containing protein [Pseudomonas savastanoi pv. phaseolicola]RMM60461.1 YD repeat-containing protein [Pseudomonas savastanoi pv. glycinea]RMQ47872.1 YD repeat-containing protein [Pseudomonas savastanoi pv. phaseolicola]RMT11972.1 YD repeat-containing protein [Pseudomonas savastanoi pv. phaseolicola]RMV74729.1 YD repeat-containing protein [Pseudomonas savastanoi pv. glycinea]
MTSSAQAVLCRYRYDPLDRLASSSPVRQEDIQRFYQKNVLATEIQGALRSTVFQHEDRLLAQQRHVDDLVDTTLLATDQQRSVLQLVDNTGVESMAYSVYGHHPPESGLTSLLGFNGERRDPATGHYLLGNGYRAYNPVLMRFNSPDSLSPFGEGGLNAYGYVSGDPVGFGDPSGHISAGLLDKLLRAGTIILAPKKIPLSQLPGMVDELPYSSATVSSTPSLPIASSTGAGLASKSSISSSSVDPSAGGTLKSMIRKYKEKREAFNRFYKSGAADQRKADVLKAAEATYREELDVTVKALEVMEASKGTSAFNPERYNILNARFIKRERKYSKRFMPYHEGVKKIRE